MYGELTDEELSWGRDLLSKIDFLNSVSKEEIDALAKSLGKQEFRPGEVIILQGEISPNLYLVHNGKVSVWIKTKPGSKKKIAEIGPGGYFGEMSLIGSTNAKATLRAEETTLVYTISGDDFFKIIQNNIEALKKIRDVIMERQTILDKEKKVL